MLKTITKRTLRQMWRFTFNPAFPSVPIAKSEIVWSIKNSVGYPTWEHVENALKESIREEFK